MKLLIVAALMFPLVTAFATVFWLAAFGGKKEDVSASWFYGFCTTLALYGILYLIFGE